MNYQDTLKSEFKSYTEAIYLNYKSLVIDQLNDFRDFLNKLEDVNKKNKLRDSGLDSDINHNTALLELINQYYKDPVAEDDVPLYEQIKNTQSEQLEKLKESYREIQNKERYFPQKGDSFSIRFLKINKRFFFHFGKAPKYTVNLLKRLFGKKTNPIQYSHHIIYSKQILEKDILPIIVGRISDFENLKYKSLAAIADELLVSEKERDFRAYKSTIKSLEDQIENKLLEDLLSNETVFLDLAFKSGTIEYPKYKLGRNKIASSNLRSKSTIKKSSNHWNNTLYALFEDWRLNKDLLLVQLKSKRFKNHFENLLNEKYQKSIKTGLDDIGKYVTELKLKLEKNKENKEQLKSYVSTSRYDINKTFSEIVKNLSEKLINQGFLGLADKLEHEITSLLDDLPESSCVIKNTTYDKPVSLKEFEYFSPHQLITYKALPEFQDDLRKVKNDLNIQIEHEYEKVRGFHDGLDFCFDSAYEMLESKEEIDLAEIIEVIESGIGRIETNQNLLSEEIKEKIETANNDLDKAVKILVEDLAHLEANENVSDIRIKITKGKAKKKGRDFLDAISVRIRKYFDILRAYTRLVVSKFLKAYNWVQTKLFLKSDDQIITSEISNLLATTHSAVESLPIIYRRLYEPKPINELNLFIGRKGELTKINKAFKEWESGSYSATMLFGERGSGLSSLVNVYVSQYKGSYKLDVFSPKRIYNSKEDFKELLSELNITHLDSDSSDKESKQKRVIIIDGLEKFFLRKVNGFDCMKSLLKLILSTDDDIFWLCTCSIHTWNYLNKTIGAQDYFDFAIELEDFSSEEIAELIHKRNQVSGYKVNYESTESDKKSRSFRKMNSAEQQTYLETQFFKRINKFAKSNISLALIFWIQMTSKIEGNEVFIKNFEQPNFNFLQSLNSLKTYILLLSVMQQILNPENLALILNCNREEAELELRVLKEDGLLIEREDKFYILNPILYRHVVDMLKIKNLLH